MMRVFRLKILRRLHEDHLATLAMLERLEKLLQRHGPRQVPPVQDAAVAETLGDLAGVLSREVDAHFAFEEAHLFTRLEALGESGIPFMLRGEHDIIRPLARRLGDLAREAQDGGFDANSWAEFRDRAEEILEREIFHIQKEEMGFLPALDQIIPADEDEALLAAYGQGHE